MSDDELLQAMLSTYYADDSPTVAADAMRAVLDVLHAHGYRRCAEGQGTTQWCRLAEDANAAQRAAENDLSKYMARAAMAEAEVERLRKERAILTEEIETLRERIGNTLDPNDYGKGIWTQND